MSIVAWGAQPKSQFDNETIEEAIARLIAVHEADEESHLGVGESLQSHKASSIIDHLAASIVEDKIGKGQVTVDKQYDDRFVLRPTFESLDAWDSAAAGAGALIEIHVGLARLVTGDASGNITKIFVSTPVGSVGFDKSPVLQAIVDFSTSPEFQDVSLFVGAQNAWASADGFGFRWDKTDGAMYCCYILSGVETKFEIVGYDTGIANTLRCEMLDNGDTINFYVNGVLKKSYINVNHNLDSDVYFSFANRNDYAGDNLEAYVRNIIFIQDW
jgi:hypothetical protein